MSGRARWIRRTRRLAIVGSLVAAVGMIRGRMIESDQRQFDRRYPVDGPT
jgi:hypothetical protein